MSFLLALIPAPIRGAVEGALLFALAAGIATGAIYLHHAGYKAGAASVQTRWDAQKLVDANAYAQTLEKVDAQHRQQQAQWEQQLAAASTQYQEDKHNVEKQRDAAIAALRAGTLRLRDPGATPTVAVGGSAVPNTAASAGGRAAGGGAELSRASSEFLLGIAADADEIVQRLTACQAVVRADRAIAPETMP